MLDRFHVRCCSASPTRASCGSCDLAHSRSASGPPMCAYWARRESSVSSPTKRSQPRRHVLVVRNRRQIGDRAAVGRRTLGRQDPYDGDAQAFVLECTPDHGAHVHSPRRCRLEGTEHTEHGSIPSSENQRHDSRRRRFHRGQSPTSPRDVFSDELFGTRIQGRWSQFGCRVRRHPPIRRARLEGVPPMRQLPRRASRRDEHPRSRPFGSSGPSSGRLPWWREVSPGGRRGRVAARRPMNP